MLTTYGVLGTGSTSKNVIEDSLNELGEDNEFLLFGERKLSASESRVLDWLCDHEVTYTVVHNTNTSESMMEFASHTIPCKSLTIEFFLKELKKRKGVLLLLWDNDRVEEMEQIVFTAADLEIEIKDLTNGLTPIVIEDEEPEHKKPTPVPTEEVEVEPFSRKDLEGMPISVLRKNAKSTGIDTESLTKSQLVDALLKEPVSEELPPPVATTLGNTPVTYNTDVKTPRETLTAPDGDCMVTVVLPNGTVVTTPATMAEVRVFLGLGGGA